MSIFNKDTEEQTEQSESLLSRIKRWYYKFTSKTSGQIAVVAVAVLVGILILSLFLAPTTINAVVFHHREYRAYCCAKEAADETLLHLTDFPSFQKVTVEEILGMSDPLISSYCKEYCKKAWVITGVLVCENKLTMEMNARFTAKVIQHETGSYECFYFDAQ